MKGLIKNWKVPAIAMVGIFCVGIVCLFHFKNGGNNFEEIEKFDNQNIELTGDNSGNNFDDKSDSNSNKNDDKKINNNLDKPKEEIYVHIVGKVKNEGVITLTKGQRIIDAIEKAGGVTDEADLNKINLAFVLSDGQKVRIPGVNDEENLREEYVTAGGGNNYIQGGSSVGSGVKVNVNSASQTELETISGVGPSLAAKIINYREKNGKFKSIEELKNVSGIGEAKFEGIKDFVDI